MNRAFSLLLDLNGDGRTANGVSFREQLLMVLVQLKCLIEENLLDKQEAYQLE